MKVEIITIGDEIIIGQIVDTNSAWMARELTQRGFNIGAITSIGDSSDAIIKAIDNAFERADILLLTGGIGPTNDDITKHTLCEYFHTALEFNDEVLQNIESIFVKRNIPLNQLTRKQAYVPVNCNVIQNKLGTAPILWFEKDEKVLVSMPGVPFEMKGSMQNDIIPLLQKKFKVTEYLSRSCIVTGVSESTLATMLSEFELQLPNGFSLAYLPSLGYIQLRLSVWGEEWLPEIKQQTQKLIKILGPFFVSKGVKMPEEMLGDKLRENNLSISTAESCTGGFISHKITIVPGSSDYYKGSIISYNNVIKEEMLDVDKKVIKSQGVVSSEVVEQMAKTISYKFHTDCSIAVSGIMGPDGGTKEKPVGTVWIATLYNSEIISHKYNVGRSRRENIEKTANLAMLQLLSMLKD